MDTDDRALVSIACIGDRGCISDPAVAPGEANDMDSDLEPSLYIESSVDPDPEADDPDSPTVMAAWGRRSGNLMAWSWPICEEDDRRVLGSEVAATGKNGYSGGPRSPWRLSNLA